MEKQMKLLGFNFTKLNIEKNPDFKGKLEIKTDMKILSVEKDKLDLIYLLKKEKISQKFYDFLISEEVSRFELMDI